MNAVRRLTIVGILVLVLCVLVLPAAAGVAGASPDYSSLSFVNRSVGWVAGIDDADYQTKVWRTTDGGVTWQPMAKQVTVGAGVAWVAFAGKTIGVWGFGGVEYTADAGDSWHPASTVGGVFQQADFASLTRGWARLDQRDVAVRRRYRPDGRRRRHLEGAVEQAGT